MKTKAYDSTNNRLVLFGGVTVTIPVSGPPPVTNYYFKDTWIGNRWTPLTSNTAPAAAPALVSINQRGGERGHCAGDAVLSPLNLDLMPGWCRLQSSQMKATFVCEQPALRFEVKTIEVVVGSGDTSNIRLPVPTVDRRHVKFVCKGNRCMLEDLGSATGVLVNDRPVQGVVDIHDGDRVAFGGVVFVAKIEA